MLRDRSNLSLIKFFWISVTDLNNNFPYVHEARVRRNCKTCWGPVVCKDYKVQVAPDLAQSRVIDFMTLVAGRFKRSPSGYVDLRLGGTPGSSAQESEITGTSSHTADSNVAA